VGRNTQGVRLVNLKDGDKLVSVEIISSADLERFADEGEEPGADGAAGDGEPAEGTTPPQNEDAPAEDGPEEE